LILSIIVLMLFNILFKEVSTVIILVKSVLLILITGWLILSVDKIVNFNALIKAFIASKKG
jgi:hypothetical protein